MAAQLPFLKLNSHSNNTVNAHKIIAHYAELLGISNTRVEDNFKELLAGLATLAKLEAQAVGAVCPRCAPVRLALVHVCAAALCNVFLFLRRYSLNQRRWHKRPNRTSNYARCAVASNSMGAQEATRTKTPQTLLNEQVGGVLHT